MGLFAQTGPATFLLLGLLALSIVMLLWRSHRYLRRQDSWSPPAQALRPGSPPDTLLDAPDDLTRWELHMHETARQLTGQLDSKMAALAQLIREADRAAARLEALRAATSQPAPDGAGPHSTSQPAPGCQAILDSPPPRPANQAEALKPAEVTDHFSEPASAPEGIARRRPDAAERYDEIYLLADYGFDAPEIAHRVGSPVGEVQLILGLRQAR